MKPAVLALIAAVAAAAWWWSGTEVPGTSISLRPAALRGTELLSGVSRAGSGPGSADRPVPAVAAVRELPDPLGGALDLKRLFDQSIASSEAGRHRVAARAFDACVPAFLVPGDQTPSPEALIRALPSAQRDERESAYRALYARCQGFAGQGRAALEDLQQQLQGDPSAQEPGRRAQEELLAGRIERVDALVAQALVAADPAAVAALSGLAARLAQARSPDASNAQSVGRALAVDAALPRVACDLGLDCGATSLLALQLCAVQGLCEGDVASRLAPARVGDVSAAEIDQQRSRLLALIRSGRPLTTADLLP